MANHSDRWYFDKESIRNTPSVRDGIEYAKELGYRQQCANLVQDIGQRLQVNQLVINTSIVFMHRFYMYHSFQTCHRNNMAACFIFLSAKVEEQPRKLEHVLKASHMCLHKDEPPLDTKSDGYMQLSAELVNNESILLQTLGFEVTVDHPNTYVVKCAQLVKASKDLAQTAYFLATNSLHLTTFCIQYKPTVVACVCIYVSCLWANYVIPDTDSKSWYEFIDNTATKQQLDDLSAYFIKILDSSPTRLKKRLTSGAVVYTDGKVILKRNDDKDVSSSKPKLTIEASKSERKPDSYKNQLTDHLKAHSHEATPPPSSHVSSNSSSHVSSNSSSHVSSKSSYHVSSNSSYHVSSNSSIHAFSSTQHKHCKNAEGKGHELKRPHASIEQYKKTAEQLKLERYKQKMTPQEWEVYKRRKEKEKQMYMKKKAMESMKEQMSVKTEQKHPTLNTSSPLKRTRVESTDANGDAKRKASISKVEITRKHMETSKQRSHVERQPTNHNRQNDNKDHKRLSPPPPPPPLVIGNISQTPVTKTLTKGAYRPDIRLQHLSPPPPPPVFQKFVAQ